MQAGKPIRLRIVDGAGKPVPNADVDILEWNGSKSIQSSHNPNHPKVPDTKIPRCADANGVWTWTSAPEGSVKVRIDGPGVTAFELDISSATPERVVTVKSEHRITGRVINAVSGRAIPAFTVIPIGVFRKDFLFADRGNALEGKNGRLNYLASRTDTPLRVRVEAAGYRSQDGPEFRVGDDSPRTQDFLLRPSPPVTGVILDADGQPVRKAEVVMATPTQHAHVSSDRNDENHRVFTDAAGRFSFPDPGEPFAVLARHGTRALPGRSSRPTSMTRVRCVCDPGLRSAGSFETAASRSPAPPSFSLRFAWTASIDRGFRARFKS